MYLYALGVCDVSRSDHKCSHSDSFTLKQIRLIPWWSSKKAKESKKSSHKAGGSASRWPPEPNPPFTFHVVHKYRNPDAPYCIYLMKHYETVQASGLTDDDEKKFPHTFVSNSMLFKNFCQGMDAEIADLSEKLKESVFVTKVVQADAVLEIVNNLQDQFSELCLTVLDKVKDDPGMLQSSVLEQLKVVNNHCSKVRSLKQLITDKELQLNKWTNEILEQQLSTLGFISAVEFPLFGKSRPDFAFYKHIDSQRLGGVYVQSDVICGGALEFKVDSSSLKLAQVFANMVRVANDILVHALKRGKLIENIVIYGLAVFHKNKQCLPMRYTCDLKKNCILFEVGELCNFFNTFSRVVLNL